MPAAVTLASAATSAAMALRRATPGLATAAGEAGTTPEDMDTAAMEDLTVFTAMAAFASRPRSVRSAPSALFGEVVLAPAAGVCLLRGAGSDMRSRCSNARVMSVP